MENTYFLIRHGESLLNSQKRHQGWRPRNPITKQGVKQAKEASEKLRNQGIQIIYASPLLRTRQTARIIAGKINKPIYFSHKLKDFRRCKQHEGLHIDEYSQRPDYLLWKEMSKIDDTFSLPEGESEKDFIKRVVDFAKSLDKNIHGQYIAVVAHQAVIRQLILYWTEEPIDAKEIDNACVYKVYPKTKEKYCLAE